MQFMRALLKSMDATNASAESSNVGMNCPMPIMIRLATSEMSMMPMVMGSLIQRWFTYAKRAASVSRMAVMSRKFMSVGFFCLL